MRCISICLQPAPNCDSCQIVFVSALYCFILKICLANSKLYNQLASPNTSHQLWAHEYTFQTPTYCTINPQYLVNPNDFKSIRTQEVDLKKGLIFFIDHNEDRQTETKQENILINKVVKHTLFFKFYILNPIQNVYQQHHLFSMYLYFGKITYIHHASNIFMITTIHESLICR